MRVHCNDCDDEYANDDDDCADEYEDDCDDEYDDYRDDEYDDDYDDEYDDEEKYDTALNSAAAGWPEVNGDLLTSEFLCSFR